jgi:hypothetical protein
MLNDWHPIARILIVGGVLLILAGLLFQFGGRYLPLLGKLPGDIVIERENFRFYFPITTMILISIVLTVLFNIIARLFR